MRCKINNCDKKVFLRGLCRYHYNMDCVKKNQKTKSCKEPGCKKKYYVNGLCMMHYKRLRPEVSIATQVMDHAEPEQVLLMSVIKMYADEIVKLEIRRTVTKDYKIRTQNLNSDDAIKLNEALRFLFDGDELELFCDFAGFTTIKTSILRKYLMNNISQRIYNQRDKKIRKIK